MSMSKPLFWRNAPLAMAALLLISCGGQLGLFRQAGRATTVHVDEFDGEIMRIAENARNTINIFFRHLNTPQTGEGNFSVKYAFPASGGGYYYYGYVYAEDTVSAEQVWIADITFRGGRYYGIVVSTPVYLADIRRGDRVSFNADSITDWMFTRNGRIIGGHSIRHLLEQIPEAERTDGQRRTLRMFE